MRRAWVLAVAAFLVAGCGNSSHPRRSADLTFETLGDTSGLSQGTPLLRSLEPYRLSNGLVRVRGTVDFPDGTRLQVSIYRKEDHALVARMQMPVEQGKFDSPPVLGPRGPLPRGDYVFELLTYFNQTWQPANVMVAGHGGLELHGPGMSRDRAGDAVFRMTRESAL
jgi:hypothetical protein